MFNYRKKRFTKELSNIFEGVSVSDKYGNVFLVKNGKVVVNKIRDTKELNKLISKLERKRNKTKFIFFDQVFRQHFSKVVYIKKEPVLVSFDVSTKEVTSENKSDENSTLKFVMEHDTRLYKDGLTGVYNKLYLSDHFDDKKINAVAMIDVDDFKKINDAYGHITGDKVLKGIAEIIRLDVSNYGKVVRFGGDEFVVIFEDIKKESLKELLERISKRISKMEFENISTIISVSIGAVYGNGYVNAFIDKADKIMYEIKKKKK